MLVDPSNSAAGSAVTGAIQQASQATGTSFNYLLATAQVESGLNALAGAATSSAKGLFQKLKDSEQLVSWIYASIGHVLSTVYRDGQK